LHAVDIGDEVSDLVGAVVPELDDPVLRVCNTAYTAKLVVVVDGATAESVGGNLSSEQT
jgi:hypothetical protein